LNMPMTVSASDQTCALCAALFGAVPAGVFAGVEFAQAKLCRIRARVYQPIPESDAVFRELFALYRQLHDGFGTAAWGGKMANVMKDLIAIRERQR
ncbi:MAG: ribulokinase, partial [bacterium]